MFNLRPISHYGCINFSHHTDRFPIHNYKSVFRTRFPEIDYKNVSLLSNYISLTGRILPRRFTKLTTIEQRFVSKAIRRARFIALIPFVWISTEGKHPIHLS
jgi:ribosomal protein S18